MNEAKPETLTKEITPWVLQEHPGQRRWEELTDQGESKQRSWPCQVACGDHHQPAAKCSPLCKHGEPRMKFGVVGQAWAAFWAELQAGKGTCSQRLEAFNRWGNVSRFQRSRVKSTTLIGNGWTSLILDKMPETPCKLLVSTVAVVVA